MAKARINTKEKVNSIYSEIAGFVGNRGYRTALLKDEISPDRIPTLCFFKPERGMVFCILISISEKSGLWSLNCGGIIPNCYRDCDGELVEGIFWYGFFEGGKGLAAQFEESFDDYLILTGERCCKIDAYIRLANPSEIIHRYADEHHWTVYDNKPD